jgi:hypothetical protein
MKSVSKKPDNHHRVHSTDFPLAALYMLLRNPITYSPLDKWRIHQKQDLGTTDWLMYVVPLMSSPGGGNL